ncbi:MAG: ubiquitin-like small modifier protein 1 [Candidatus Hermodarchaeota archaeon]|jgi:molybdopterin synthase sulfur carrier subunit|nr:ubiquitin-like small modifier protein 1 [Candidatus Hermodarchaeota archaeon]
MPKKPKVTVRMFTSLRALTGTRETELEAANVQEVIDILGNRFGSKFSQMVLEPDGALKSYFHVLVNGRHIRLQQGVQTALTDGDVVAIFPPIGGG